MVRSTTRPVVPRQTALTSGSVLTDAELAATIVSGMLDAAPDGLLMIDAGGRIALVNSRVEELFGYDEEELRGQQLEMLLPEDARAAHVGHRRTYTEHPRRRPMGIGLTLRGRRKDGSEFPVDISLSPVTTADGSWAIAAIRDDTERQAAEYQRRENAVVEEQTRIGEDLADTVIRGLFGVGLSLQSLADRPDQDLRSGVQEAIDEIDRIIRDLRSAVFGLRTRSEAPARDPEIAGPR